MGIGHIYLKKRIMPAKPRDIHPIIDLRDMGDQPFIQFDLGSNGWKGSNPNLDSIELQVSREARRT